MFGYAEMETLEATPARPFLSKIIMASDWLAVGDDFGIRGLGWVMVSLLAVYRKIQGVGLNHGGGCC